MEEILSMDMITYICLFFDSFNDIFLLIAACKKWYFLLIPKNFIPIKQTEKNNIGFDFFIFFFKKNFLKLKI
jgi:hypothetical protein